MRITQKMPAFEGVAAGQTATLKLPIGLTYHELFVAYGGATLAQLNEARLVINSKTEQRYVELSELDVLNQFEGAAAANGIIRIPIGDRYGMITRAGRELAMLGTGMVDDPNPITYMALEIDIDAAAVAPTLSAIARQSAPSHSGLIKKVRRKIYNPAAAGEYQISDIPVGLKFEKMVFKSANINSVKIERDGRKIFERTAAENNLIQTDGARVPQAGYFVVDMSEDGFGSDFIETANVQDFRIYLDMSAGGQVVMQSVEIGYVGE